MRVCLVGPVAPYRSGIAHHTSALLRDLIGRPSVDVLTLSFARQYPAWLYPGAIDRDKDANTVLGTSVEFDLDSMNPLTWRRAIRRVAAFSPELVLMPAWTFFVAPCLGTIARSLRRSGTPVTMIVHNAADHEAAHWKANVLNFQLRQASRFVTHNGSIAAELARIVPGTPTIVCPHPSYDDFPEPKNELPRRAALELLCFGFVRPYKGIDIALQALALSGRQDVKLSVVGEFWSGRNETEALIRDLGLTGKVELVPRYVTDQETAEYFARCDAVVAPYRSATGSGVVALAQRYGRPVIASDVDGLAHAIVDGKTGWLFPAGDAVALGNLLSTRVDRRAADAMSSAIDTTRAALSWRRFGDAVLHSV